MQCCAIDLFCGIGGLTKGLELAGVNVVAGVDVDVSCGFAYEKNNSSKFICEDVLKIEAEQLERLYPRGALKALVGCAPCQPFSKYTKRYRKGGQVDDRWQLLYSFSDLVKKISPPIVSMENVPGLSKEKVFADFLRQLEACGYNFSWTIVNCSDYGVPQNRKRLVLLASLLGNIALVPPLYSPKDYKTVRQAIGGLPTLEDGQICRTDCLHRACRLSNINKTRIRQSNPGGTWRDWGSALQLSCHKKNSGKSYPSVYGRMLWDKPSPTITTQFYGYGNGRFGHPEQDRALSIREGAILQSFPKDYIFINDNDKSFNKRQLGAHIGNAVPVELGHAIGLSIKKHLEEVLR